jgi:hypothetical protein
MCLALIIGLLSTNTLLAAEGMPGTIPTSIAEFENSTFFKGRDIYLDSIEPLRIKGEIESWLYNYITTRESGANPAAQYGVRLKSDLSRDEPFIIVRWFPVRSIDRINFKPLDDLFKEYLGIATGQTISGIKEFARKEMAHKNKSEKYVPTSPEWQSGEFTIYCTYTYGNAPRYPQLTVIIKKRQS